METVTHEEQARIRLLAFAPLFQFDNFHYQHRQGVRIFAPQWKQFDSTHLYERPSFQAEGDRIASESEAESEDNEQ